jgi:hypothetical protein
VNNLVGAAEGTGCVCARSGTVGDAGSNVGLGAVCTNGCLMRLPGLDCSGVLYVYALAKSILIALCP